MNIKLLRENRKLSQKEVYLNLNLNQNTYSQYETGKRQPKIEQLPKLAEILDCSIEELVLALIETKKQAQQESFNH